MHCVVGVWQTGHSGSADWQICPAHSMQKRLWPQGTRAAVTSLSKHTKQSLLTPGATPTRPATPGPLFSRPSIPELSPTPLPPLSESVGEPPGSEEAEQEEYPVDDPPELELDAPEKEPPPAPPDCSHDRVLRGSLWARRASGWSRGPTPPS